MPSFLKKLASDTCQTFALALSRATAGSTSILYLGSGRSAAIFITQRACDSRGLRKQRQPNAPRLTHEPHAHTCAHAYARSTSSTQQMARSQARSSSWRSRWLRNTSAQALHNSQLTNEKSPRHISMVIEADGVCTSAGISVCFCPGWRSVS